MTIRDNEFFSKFYSLRNWFKSNTGAKLTDIKNECSCERDDITEVDVEKYY